MEQLETDDKLVEGQKEKKSKLSFYLLIGICSICILCWICLLYNYMKAPKAGAIDGSKKKFYYLILI